MKKSLQLMTTITLALFLAGCANKRQAPTQIASNFLQRQDIVTTTNQTYPAKNPQTVAWYTNDQSPNSAYRIIGVAKVSKYNLLGVKRHDAMLNNMMKNLAASIGGDGVININTTDEAIQGNVIAFQRILI